MVSTIRLPPDFSEIAAGATRYLFRATTETNRVSYSTRIRAALGAPPGGSGARSPERSATHASRPSNCPRAPHLPRIRGGLRCFGGDLDRARDRRRSLSAPSLSTRYARISGLNRFQPGRQWWGVLHHQRKNVGCCKWKKLNANPANAGREHFGRGFLRQHYQDFVP